MHADETNENENLFLILSILHEAVGDTGRWMRYGELLDRVSEKYTPSRLFKAGRPPSLSKGTVSKWVRRLTDSNLIRAELEARSHKSKIL